MTDNTERGNESNSERDEASAPCNVWEKFREHGDSTRKVITVSKYGKKDSTWWGVFSLRGCPQSTRACMQACMCMCRCMCGCMETGPVKQSTSHRERGESYHVLSNVNIETLGSFEEISVNQHKHYTTEYEGVRQAPTQCNVYSSQQSNFPY